MDVTVDAQGRVLVGYADGCIGGCVQSGPNSFSSYATIARQLDGPRLFTKLDPKPGLTVSDIVTSEAKKSTTVSATVTNNSTADAANVVVRFLDGTTLIGDSAPISLAKGESKTVTVTWFTKNVHGTRTVTAVADPLNLVGESNENNNQAQRTVTLK